MNSSFKPYQSVQGLEFTLDSVIVQVQFIPKQRVFDGNVYYELVLIDLEYLNISRISDIPIDTSSDKFFTKVKMMLYSKFYESLANEIQLKEKSCN